jgi:alpha-mannosidase
MGDGPVKVISAAADQMFLDIKPEMQSKMPTYKGDLELINHSAGSLTSAGLPQALEPQERNSGRRSGEGFRSSGMDGRPSLSAQRLNDAWTLVMGGQFHDTGAGTATPRSYEFAQNDDVIAMNQFAGVLTSATQAVASSLDTEGSGIPIVVYNPLNIEREDVVEADVSFPGGTPKAVHVVGPDGRRCRADVARGKVLFLAKAPSVGYAVYDVREGRSDCGFAGIEGQRIRRLRTRAIA